MFEKTNFSRFSSKALITGCLSFALAAGFISNLASAKDKQDPKLVAKAKITREAAEKTALGKVPNGKVKDAELEEEKGKLIWSFDLSTPGSKNTTEVNVDAITGAIVAVDIEKPQDEAKETKEEKQKAKK